MSIKSEEKIMGKIKRVKKEITITYFSPATTEFYNEFTDNSGKTVWSIEGRGYGEAVDEEGNIYLLWGNEIGGGDYGEDADKKFMKPGKKYIVTSIWVNTFDKKDRSSQDKFFDLPFRIRTMTLLDGTKPNSKNYQKISNKCEKLGGAKVRWG